MGDVMLFGVLRMPYDMAMADEFTRYQYHQRGLQAADAIEALRAQLAEARDKALEDAAQCCEREADRCDDAAIRGGSRTYVNNCKAAAYAMRDRANAIRALIDKPGE